MFPPWWKQQIFLQNFWRNEKEIVNLQRECVIKSETLFITVIK